VFDKVRDLLHQPVPDLSPNELLVINYMVKGAFSFILEEIFTIATDIFWINLCHSRMAHVTLDFTYQLRTMVSSGRGLETAYC
jgi:hypothetical protein